MRRREGFTLIELLVTMAIIAMLLAVALPRYFTHLDRSRETILKQDLAVMRDAIDKYHADKGLYPDTLETLVDQRYLRTIPVDPVTESPQTWQVVSAPDGDTSGVYDVRSGAAGTASDGSPYAEW
ncbi:MAG: type II secretion system protein G [Hydrogenophilales bacterium 16-64-46]|nr:MAG: type II secretion system protein G [Hydrogenophilales bacterium 12-64-13]OYZ05656.1 MAG: type II secretion system protein G [Hydrogenophilales bacterium 16-64-46]OZA40235.1 MAG: type II secretion system protein G [Hydrogenophilales bacterium 17-64-34]HQT00785.1 prepilin-type N-terminal cleavage/methylation domain-containing protein [Thiobacillus sp.]